MRIAGSSVLVTGASSGIGREVARECARRGAKRIFLAARRKERLDELASEIRSEHPGVEVRGFPVDLGKREGCESLLAALREERIDVLVNNAGIGVFGVFDGNDLDRLEELVGINVLAPLRLSRAFLPAMISRGTGGILNISSGFGLSFFPGYAAYVGSKHFLTGFTEALLTDLRGTGVTVTQSCPGPVATEFAGTVRDFVGGDVPSWIEISGETCAARSLDALERGKALVVPSPLIAFALCAQSIVPRAVRRFFLSRVGQKIRGVEARRRLPSA